MNRIIRNILFVLAGILIIFLTGPQALPAQTITIIGELNDQNELVSSEDGAIYELAENKMADRLVSEHRGEKMRVFGILLNPVQESSVDELPKGLIEVTSFEDVPE